MRILKGWLPHPLLSAVLWIGWLWLNDTTATGHIVLGALLAWSIPMFTHRFWPERVPVRRPLRILEFVVVVLFDIVVANLQVARLILNPRVKLQSGFARVPLALTSAYAITVFASTISLTPGTVSVALSADRRTLIVHYLNSGDPDELVATVKRRYEARIREIFESC